ncbi:MAG: hypothetical protein EPN70_07595 [Paraburkholderia sp.]|uniref:hypothetical protein n=1 Tax=Paraburkholderia sp. TaxID=1926495 RepID=UPI001212AB33|nr:hypothetical protein [Paraburkholderia sp.]TAM05729.1 MAG: hypothetical protein EPN70_07595 [Paraburkholderia sp.]
MTRELVSILADLSPAEKRALLEMMYQLARRQLATGYDTTGRPVCAADFAITNNARKRLEEWKR